MSNELCLKSLSLAQNFIQNDLIRVIVMTAARCDPQTRTMIQHVDLNPNNRAWTV
jgi:hypothetical protein